MSTIEITRPASDVVAVLREAPLVEIGKLVTTGIVPVCDAAAAAAPAEEEVPLFALLEDDEPELLPAALLVPALLVPALLVPAFEAAALAVPAFEVPAAVLPEPEVPAEALPELDEAALVPPLFAPALLPETCPEAAATSPCAVEVATH